jgi:hypothetical protein
MREETAKALFAWVKDIHARGVADREVGTKLLIELALETFVPDCDDPDGSIARFWSNLHTMLNDTPSRPS